MATAPRPSETALDRSEDSSTTTLYRAAIGPVNTDYYLGKFARFEAADQAGPSWNWAASLLTLNWMAYRKLWGAALTYAGSMVGLALLVFGIGRLVLKFDEITDTALLAAFTALAFGVPGIFGNALYHASCRKKMAQALAANATLPEACAMLQRQASSKPRLIWLALANAVLAGAVVGAALWLPNAGMLPGALGSPSQKPTEGRNVVVGRTTDATTAAAPTAVAASAPASAPATVTLPAAPLTAASAAASATPLSAASSATATVTAASAPVTTTPAPKAPAPIINTPTPAPTKPVAPAPVVDKPLQSKAAAASAPRVAAAAAPKVVASVPAVAVVPRPAARPVKAPESTAPVGKLPAATAKAPSSATKEETFHVNVGLFADENNARNAHTKLLDAGLASVSQEFSTAKGKRTRVRVGPFATRAEADTAADKIRALGLDAIVIQP